MPFMQLLPLVVLLLFTACSHAQDNPASNKTISIERDILNEIAPRFSSHPLPEGWRFIIPEENGSQNTPRTAGASIVRITADWNISNSGGYGDQDDRTADGKEISSGLFSSLTVFAPVVKLWDVRDNVTSAEIRSGNVVVKPIKEIFPPERALPVDGRYPGDKGYPLISTHFLFCDSDDSEIAGWFSSLASDNEQRNEDRPDSFVEWIAGAGDIMVGRGVEDILIRRENGSETIFGDLLPLMRSADVLIGNLEGAVTRRGSPAGKSYTFRFRPEVLPVLKSAGFDYLSITNNHSYDYGTTGFSDTLAALEAAGLGTSGAGPTIEKAQAPWKITAGRTNITVLSLGAYSVERTGFDGKREASVSESRPGILWEGDNAFSAVSKAATGKSYDIVVVHGGTEWMNKPTVSQRQLYRKLVDLGADLVLGSHPHVLQGIEAYRGKTIVYSLGNYVFPGMQETDYGEESLLLFIGIYEGAARYLRYIPVKLNGTRISEDHTGKILSRFLALTESENRTGREKQ